MNTTQKPNAIKRMARDKDDVVGVAGIATLKRYLPNLAEPVPVEVVIVAPDADSLADAMRLIRTNPDPSKNQVVRIKKEDL